MPRVSRSIPRFSRSLLIAALTAMGLAATLRADDGKHRPTFTPAPPYAFDPAAVAPSEAATPDKRQSPPYVPPQQMIENGYGRNVTTTRVPLTPERLSALLAAGKSVQIDPVTGEQVIQTIEHVLPQNWRRAPQGERVDSYGNPIVNDVPGWPGWAQRDVDGLRADIGAWTATLASRRASGTDVAETEGILGNLIGQAIVRRIDISDLVTLGDAAVATPGVAAAIIAQLHIYENVKFIHQADGGYAYSPTVYGDNIATFVAASGANLSDVLAIESGEDVGVRGGPSCYNRVMPARGMTNLTTPFTTIWNGSAGFFDDEQADIPLGFENFVFYSCEDRDSNNSVRVSTNGFLTFFQQGGGALNGTQFSNSVLPSASDPDGMAAAWWDDLSVENQGTTDRVSYKTEGAVGSRVLTVEWFSVSRLGGSSTNLHSFQVKLFETTGVIEFHYGPNGAGWVTDTFDNSTTGIESYSGSRAECGTNCLNTNNPPPATNFRYTPLRPQNDSCASPILVQEGTSLFGDLIDATRDGSATCGTANTNRDVWYRFNAVCNGTLRVNTCGTNDAPGVDAGMDTVLSLFGTCGGAELACNDDASPSCTNDTGNLFDSAIDRAMTVGQSVLIRVSHYDTSLDDGLFMLHVHFVPTTPAANDACANANVLTGLSGTRTGSFNCATNDGTASCGDSATNADEWFIYTATCDGALTVDTCGTHDAPGLDLGMDCVLAAFSGCAGTELACLDDEHNPPCPGDTGFEFDSRITVPIAALQSVLIRLSYFRFSLANGAYRLHYNFVNAPAPNDSCANPEVLTGTSGTRSGNISCSTNDGNSSCGASTGNRDVWFSFTAPNACSGRLTVSTCGTNDLGGVDTGMDTVLNAFSGCGGQELDCNDDSGPFCPGAMGNLYDSRIQVALGANQNVRVRLSHFGASISTGTYRLQYQFDRCPGDLTGDHRRDGDDVQRFADCLFAGGPPGCECADINNDTIFNNVDAGLFVDLLLFQPDCP